MQTHNSWSFYRTSSGVRLCRELEEPKGPKGFELCLRQFGHTNSVSPGFVYPKVDGFVLQTQRLNLGIVVEPE